MGACAGASSHRSKAKNNNFQQLAMQEDSLICGVCINQYNLTDRHPVMLCINQHNACRVCVDRFVNCITPLCPFCRVDISPSRLSKNRILIEILQQLTLKPQTKDCLIEAEQTKIEKILNQARKFSLQKVIYHIQSGIDLSTVKQMHLWNLKLTQIIDFSIFSGLKSLDLHKNSIAQIKNISHLTGLTFLNLGSNSITKIQGLQTLINLQFLDLSHNQIAKIQNLSDLSNLSTLNLNHNNIQIVQNLHRLRYLTILYIKHNPISPQTNQGSIKALQYRGVFLQLSSTSSIASTNILTPQ